MPKPECQGYREWQGSVAELEKLVRELQAHVKINATNASMPPSAFPLDAPKSVVKKPTGRKPSGQPGHPAHERVGLSPRLANEVVPWVPQGCAHYQAKVPAEPPADAAEPRWHQVAELPPRLVDVTECQAHARSCRECGLVTCAKIPDDQRSRRHGPRLTALVSYWSGSPHICKRGIEEVLKWSSVYPSVWERLPSSNKR